MRLSPLSLLVTGLVGVFANEMPIHEYDAPPPPIGQGNIPPRGSSECAQMAKVLEAFVPPAAPGSRPVSTETPSLFQHPDLQQYGPLLDFIADFNRLVLLQEVKNAGPEKGPISLDTVQGDSFRAHMGLLKSSLDMSKAVSRAYDARVMDQIKHSVATKHAQILRLNATADIVGYNGTESASNSTWHSPVSPSSVLRGNSIAHILGNSTGNSTSNVAGALHRPEKEQDNSDKPAPKVPTQPQRTPGAEQQTAGAVTEHQEPDQGDNKGWIAGAVLGPLLGPVGVYFLGSGIKDLVRARQLGWMSKIPNLYSDPNLVSDVSSTYSWMDKISNIPSTSADSFTTIDAMSSDGGTPGLSDAAMDSWVKSVSKNPRLHSSDLNSDFFKSTESLKPPEWIQYTGQEYQINNPAQQPGTSPFVDGTEADFMRWVENNHEGLRSLENRLPELPNDVQLDTPDQPRVKTPDSFRSDVQPDVQPDMGDHPELQQLRQQVGERMGRMSPDGIVRPRPQYGWNNPTGNLNGPPPLNNHVPLESLNQIPGSGGSEALNSGSNPAGGAAGGAQAGGVAGSVGAPVAPMAAAGAAPVVAPAAGAVGAGAAGAAGIGTAAGAPAAAAGGLAGGLGGAGGALVGGAAGATGSLVGGVAGAGSIIGATTDVAGSIVQAGTDVVSGAANTLGGFFGALGNLFNSGNSGSAASGLVEDTASVLHQDHQHQVTEPEAHQQEHIQEETHDEPREEHHEEHREERPDEYYNEYYDQHYDESYGKGEKEAAVAPEQPKKENVPDTSDEKTAAGPQEVKTHQESLDANPVPEVIDKAPSQDDGNSKMDQKEDAEGTAAFAADAESTVVANTESTITVVENAESTAAVVEDAESTTTVVEVAVKESSQPSVRESRQPTVKESSQPTFKKSSQPSVKVSDIKSDPVAQTASKSAPHSESTKAGDSATTTQVYVLAAPEATLDDTSFEFRPLTTFLDHKEIPRWTTVTRPSTTVTSGLEPSQSPYYLVSGVYIANVEVVETVYGPEATPGVEDGDSLDEKNAGFW